MLPRVRHSIRRMTGAAHARDVVPTRVAVLDVGRSSLRAAVFDGPAELVDLVEDVVAEKLDDVPIAGL